MIFSYETITPNLKRPIIPILIKSKISFIIYRALIDSGADYCIFSVDLADLLGIRLFAKDKVRFMGVGLDRVIGYWNKIEIRIGRITYSTNVIFAEISDFGHGILGQNGFFDHFDVSLSFDREIIELEPIKIRN